MNNISVIIPTFNRHEYLVNCIVSVLSQNYAPENFEIIVVDNSKDANAEKIVTDTALKNQRDITYIHERKQGLVYARHTGAKAAKFDILAFTDDDGVLDKNWLKEINNMFELNSNISAVAGKIEVKWDMLPPEWIIPYEIYLGKHDYGPDLFFSSDIHINGGNFIIKKEILFKLKGFNPGQLGEYLAGDSETGLCRKLQKNNYLIGWAPKAVMYHCQTVAKNATVKDISRRYFNNGIADGYDFYVVEEKKGVELVVDVLKTMIRISILSIIYFFRTDKKKAIFTIKYQLGKLSFYKKAVFSKEYKEILKNKDWEL